MSDMSPAIVPKSDQINADDLLSGPITIKIRDVQIKPGQEQPVSIYFEGSDKAYRCCKSMARVIVAAWGADASKYKGRSLTLYCDPKVKWAGMDVGGIRISHMSDISAPITMALTVTRANKKPFTVRPIAAGGTKSAAPDAGGTASTPPLADAQDAAPLITPDEALALEARCTDNGIDVARLRKKAGVERIADIKAADLPRAHAWLDGVIAKQST